MAGPPSRKWNSIRKWNLAFMRSSRWLPGALGGEKKGSEKYKHKYNYKILAWSLILSVMNYMRLFIKIENPGIRSPTVAFFPKAFPFPPCVWSSTFSTPPWLQGAPVQDCPQMWNTKKDNSDATLALAALPHTFHTLYVAAYELIKVDLFIPLQAVTFAKITYQSCISCPYLFVLLS